AYIFDNQSLMKVSDDGEPQKTAGIPMLEILKHHDLTDVLAVVTRYFGGVKLGAGGLIRAYASSVGTALQGASFTTKLEKKVYLVQVPYALYDSFIYQTKDLVTILEQNFEINVAIKLYLNQITIETLTDQFNGQLTIEQLDIITVYDPLE
ncbi:MAG TPA: YigZ family protein, partial [Acholeplasma sp.]|nr:YigZ family protein [Acholeplasma sp.]